MAGLALVEETQAPSKNRDKTDDVWVSWEHMKKTTYFGLLFIVTAASNIAAHPFSVIATRQQAGIVGDVVMKATAGPWESILAIKETMRKMGFRSIYRGLGPSLLVCVPSSVLYMAVTESTRESIQRRFATSAPSLPPAVVDTAQASITAVIANTVSIGPYLPADVVSSRLMIQGAQSVGSIEMCRRIARESGVRGFYRGLNASLLLGFAFSTQWWATYSIARRELARLTGLNETSPKVFDAAAGVAAGFTTALALHPLDTIRLR